MTKKCCFCKIIIKEFGNNAEPIKKGVCCDECNKNIVIPIRIKNIMNRGK